MDAIIRSSADAGGTTPAILKTSKQRLPVSVSFGSAMVLPRARQLHVCGKQVAINNCAFEMLLMLIEADGQLVTKNDLFRRLWPKVCVADNNLRVQMCKLRRALGRNADAIKTVPNRGYRITATLHISRENETGAPDAAHDSRPSGEPARSTATTIVIIVDHDNDVRAALDTLLRSGITLEQRESPAT